MRLDRRDVFARKVQGTWHAGQLVNGDPDDRVGPYALGRTRREAVEALRRKVRRLDAAFRATFLRRGKGKPHVKMKFVDRYRRLWD